MSAHEKTKLKLADWASVAEILGAFAIVVSLLFVGFQINDSNRETRAATAQAALDLEMLFETQIAQYAGTWQKVLTGMSLADGEESRRGIVLFNMMMTLNENRRLLPATRWSPASHRRSTGNGP